MIPNLSLVHYLNPFLFFLLIISCSNVFKACILAFTSYSSKPCTLNKHNFPAALLSPHNWGNLVGTTLLMSIVLYSIPFPISSPYPSKLWFFYLLLNSQKRIGHKIGPSSFVRQWPIKSTSICTNSQFSPRPHH